MAQQWTIKQVAKQAGTTSRTLRYYDQIDLLKPSAVSENGYRLYDASALIRLQRILALRDLGMSLLQIQSVLDREQTEIEALTDLEHHLRQELSRLERQISTVQRTLTALRKGESPMSENMFDGFEHEDFKEEVEERWGEDAWQKSNNWWSSLGEDEQAAYQQKVMDLTNAWRNAHKNGVTAESPEAQDLARQHVTWLSEIPGPYTWGECTLKEYVINLGEMYVNDPRFASTYGGEPPATLVRDALKIYADANL